MNQENPAQLSGALGSAWAPVWPWGLAWHLWASVPSLLTGVHCTPRASHQPTPTRPVQSSQNAGASWSRPRLSVGALVLLSQLTSGSRVRSGHLLQPSAPSPSPPAPSSPPSAFCPHRPTEIVPARPQRAPSWRIVAVAALGPAGPSRHARLCALAWRPGGKGRSGLGPPAPCLRLGPSHPREVVSAGHSPS